MVLAPVFPVLAFYHNNVREGRPDGVQERREKAAEQKEQSRQSVQEKREQRQENLQEKREAGQERREAVGERRQEAKENIQEKRQEQRQRLVERRKQLIRAFFERMVKRFEAALERAGKLADRIQSRIEKARANGRDVTNAQAALDRAKILWQDAKLALDAAKGKLEGALNADTPKQAFEEVRSLVRTAGDKIKDVHAALVDAITVLKGIGRGAGQPAATSTTP